MYIIRLAALRSFKSFHCPRFCYLSELNLYALLEGLPWVLKMETWSFLPTLVLNSPKPHIEHWDVVRHFLGDIKTSLYFHNWKEKILTTEKFDAVVKSEAPLIFCWCYVRLFIYYSSPGLLFSINTIVIPSSLLWSYSNNLGQRNVVNTFGACKNCSQKYSFYVKYFVIFYP